jgi:hypothetical protein
MTARLVHSVMAAGLENPELIARWRDDPRCSPGGVSNSSDWTSTGWEIRRAGGKNPHNGVREKLPLSFRLMSVARLEIEVFAAYAEDRSRSGLRYAASVEDKTRDLVAFLGMSTWRRIRGNVHWPTDPHPSMRMRPVKAIRFELCVMCSSLECSSQMKPRRQRRA